ncbi:MAG: hypothetical protein A2355_07520, partial [Spirochaetes bacterium RIFOXYB1_FULL_32_8]
MTKGRILIVDDSLISREILANALVESEFEVSSVSSGEKALQKIEQFNPELILLDINMPGMNGFQFCDILKNEMNRRDILIIFITGSKNKEITSKGFACGCVDFITKPYEIEELIARVTVHLNLKHSEKRLTELKTIADEANTAKSDFLANMSHEIRTPMSAIIGFTEILLSTHISAIQRDYLEMIEISANSLLDIINDILDFSKLESGKFTISPSSCNVKSNITSIIHTYSIQSLKKGVELLYQIDDSIPEFIIADSTRLRQVLINLISNAIKFTDQGSVFLRIQKKLKNNVAMLHFSIEDTGLGISPEKMSLLFEKFTQIENKNTKKYKGSGLGLVICKSLVELMGGTIHVSSRLSQGSTFSFEIPLIEDTNIQDNEIIEELTVPYENNLSLNILLADDYFVNQKMITAILLKKGWNVSIASTGIEALNKIEESKFDIILMDMHMPEMDGITATTIIRESEKLSGIHVPIIALTASAFEQDKKKCLESGMDDFISKPVDTELLYQIIIKYAGDKVKQCKSDAEYETDDKKLYTPSYTYFN